MRGQATQYSEDRLQLLETIHEMIDFELDRRQQTGWGNPHPEFPVPIPVETPPPEKPPPRNTLWHRFVNLFTDCR